MDVERYAKDSNKKSKRWMIWGIGGIAAVVTIIVTANLGPASPVVKLDTLYIDTVRQGEMLIDIRAPGNLVPVNKQWLSSRSAGLVRRVVLLPGAEVQADTVIINLENPDLENQLRESALKLQVAKAELSQLNEQVANDLLASKSRLAQVTAQLKRAEMDLDAFSKLSESGVVSKFELKKAELAVDQLRSRFAIEQQALESLPRMQASQLTVKRLMVRQLEHDYSLSQDLVGNLNVKAQISGTLQDVSVEEGQRVAVGTILGSVARPGSLKAELRVQEGQAKEIRLKLPVKVGVNGTTLVGTVSRISPSVRNGTVTVDVLLPSSLPKGARPDLRIDGAIEVARLRNVLYIGRPAGLQTQTSDASIFVVDGQLAHRTPVRFGRQSASTVQLIKGPPVGSRVVLSDVSAWDGVDAMRLN